MNPTLFTILPKADLPKRGAQEVGIKAWNLMLMVAADLPVPAAFVLPTDWCRGQLNTSAGDLQRTLTTGIEALEHVTGLGFGSVRRPLLVSVRSGAAVSMPGMLETVLDVGLNTALVQGLTTLTGNPRLGWDCFRRLIQTYAEVVLHLPRDPFDRLVSQAMAGAKVASEQELSYSTLRELAGNMLDLFRELAGVSFPEDPAEQLLHSVHAVFDSWNAPKAVAYRRVNGISDDGGTAVTVQRMVFGNAGSTSGSGVAFTRNPATGEPGLYVDYQINAQGEDVVSGRRRTRDESRLRHASPASWTQLEKAGNTLEALFRDAQDFEFTVESSHLYLLQSRSAKRTPWAALRIAVDQVTQGLISEKEALSRLAGISLDLVVRTRFADPAAQPLAYAQVAGMGVAEGRIAFDCRKAAEIADRGEPVILVREETDTADIEGLSRAEGILTASGNRTSHAAVVARQLGKVCLVGCTSLRIDLEMRSCHIGPKAFYEGDLLSLDGNTGGIYAGQMEKITERPERELATVAKWRASLVESETRRDSLVPEKSLVP